MVSETNLQVVQEKKAMHTNMYVYMSVCIKTETQRKRVAKCDSR